MPRLGPLVESDWVHLNPPTIAVTDEHIVLPHGRILGRRAGEVLQLNREPWPGWEPERGDGPVTIVGSARLCGRRGVAARTPGLAQGCPLVGRHWSHKGRAAEHRGASAVATARRRGSGLQPVAWSSFSSRWSR